MLNTQKFESYFLNGKISKTFFFPRDNYLKTTDQKPQKIEGKTMLFMII